MLKKRMVRLIVGWIFDNVNDETLVMINTAVDAELAERGINNVPKIRT